MATAYIYNGYGSYETRGEERGITLRYGGVEFWLPFQKVVTIPDWTLREVDHDATAAPEGEEGALTYKTFQVPGGRIVEELTEVQIPYKNREMGIIAIKGKPTGNVNTAYAGRMLSGEAILVEAREVEPTKAEKDEATKLAHAYKETVIQEYLQSKRERMAGGHGRLTPTGIVRVFMEELGVADIDDLSNHRRSGGVDLELIKAVVELTRGATEINYDKLVAAVESVRKGDGPQLARQKPKPKGLDAYRETYDAALAEGLTPAEAKTRALAARDGVAV